jgi:glycosyltransferase involved in cell wall biosynthesis
MLLKEWTTQRQQSSFNLHISILWQYDATVVLNKHEFDVMTLYDEHDRLYYIPNSIDLERINAQQVSWEYANRPAIGSFDVPRLEKLPSHIIWAMPTIVDKIPTARLNVFSLHLEPIGTWRNMYCRSKGRVLEHLCENIQMENNNLMPFMKGVDIGFNNNFSGIASRVTMEMQAMGKPVISYGGDYTPYVARVFDIKSIADQVVRCWKDIQADPEGVAKRTRKYVAQNYDREKHVKSYIRLYEKLLNG